MNITKKEYNSIKILYEMIKDSDPEILGKHFKFEDFEKLFKKIKSKQEK